MLTLYTEPTPWLETSMTRKIIDLSIFLENDVISDPPAFAPKIEYFTHQDSFEQIEPFFKGLKKSDLPDGEGWAVERVNLSTHNGTHLDAPYHFHSTMNKALGRQEPSISIDEVPLDWYFQPASSSTSPRSPTVMSSLRPTSRPNSRASATP